MFFKNTFTGSRHCAAGRPGGDRRVQHHRRGVDVLLLPRLVHRPGGPLQVVKVLRRRAQLHPAHQLLVPRNHRSRLFPVSFILLCSAAPLL